MSSKHVNEIDQRIWAVVSKIPVGQVKSYGQVAREAGLERAPRRVTPALNRAPDEMQLPWQRVVGANGRIAFPLGSPGYQRQRKLLEHEGVVFNGPHIASSYMRANGKKTGDLDAQLWELDD